MKNKKNINKPKVSFLNVIILMLLVLNFNCDTDDTQKVTNFNNLVLEDEFEVSGAPDASLWNYNIGRGQNGWGNNEQQYYTDRPENVIVEDGVLKITARQESFEGSNYTSARLLTNGKFEQTYGRFEARIKLPWGRGIWPAFWLLGEDENGTQVWPQIGEIDIMENRGQEPTIINGTLHGPGYSAGQSITTAFELDDDRFDTDFHIFGIEWDVDYINFYVDNHIYKQITPADVPGEWVFNHPFYILLNVAVGGDYVGPVGANTVFPQTMEVDYVRVYSAD